MSKEWLGWRVYDVRSQLSTSILLLVVISPLSHYNPIPIPLLTNIHQYSRFPCAWNGKETDRCPVSSEKNPRLSWSTEGHSHRVNPKKMPSSVLPRWYIYILQYWLVVWTPLKNISQLGWLFPIYGKKMFQTTNQYYNDSHRKWNRGKCWPPKQIEIVGHSVVGFSNSEDHLGLFETGAYRQLLQVGTWW